MRVAYVAKHDSGDNDDEGAIADAFEREGHHVIRFVEGSPDSSMQLTINRCDLVLWHKWPQFNELKTSTPKVCWYFDLVQSNQDAILKRRLQPRINYLLGVEKVANLILMSDGDWINFRKDQCNIYKFFNQGADQRVMGVGSPIIQVAPLLFAGAANNGVKRELFIQRLKDRYGTHFQHLGIKPHHRVHGRKLANWYSSAKIVIAPDGPNTDRYWSNRVYQVLGFGGFLLHPYCSELRYQFDDREHLVYYHDPVDFDKKVERYLNDDAERTRIAANGLLEVSNHHTYVHRIRQLVSYIKEMKYV